MNSRYFQPSNISFHRTSNVISIIALTNIKSLFVAVLDGCLLEHCRLVRLSGQQDFSNGGHHPYPRERVQPLSSQQPASRDPPGRRGGRQPLSSQQPVSSQVAGSSPPGFVQKGPAGHKSRTDISVHAAGIPTRWPFAPSDISHGLLPEHRHHLAGFCELRSTKRGHWRTEKGSVVAKDQGGRLLESVVGWIWNRPLLQFAPTLTVRAPRVEGVFFHLRLSP